MPSPTTPASCLWGANAWFFVFAGANDPRVPRSESDQIVKAMRERGVAVEYMVAPNEGHSLDRRDNQIACTLRVARFLEKALVAAR